ncbi:MAG: glycine cleavage system aminomethyltransferase GcvT [Pseudomonadota bacterium]
MEEDLFTTPLDALHRELGARMVPFAGYAMPLQYQLGIMKEHLHCRAAAGLFDVSHMGQVQLWPLSGNVADAAKALETLVPVDVLGLKPGRQRYGLFTNDDGGILDDLMIANRGDHLLLVVNAACKADDIAHMKAHLSETCRIEVLDRALLALQGPEAGQVLEAIAPEAKSMRFMDVADLSINGIDCTVSRSGYTGEDGFEISVANEDTMSLAKTLLQHNSVEPIGLGARDSLRLEAGLCLYGNDIDTGTTPNEAALTWAIQKVRRNGGDREGGFPGASRILGELTDGAPRRRVGLQPEGRAPVRTGAPVLDASGQQIGHVTSGVFGPTIEGPVAMGYVANDHSETGTEIQIEVRGKHLPAKVVDLPFITPGYKR